MEHFDGHYVIKRKLIVTTYSLCEYINTTMYLIYKGLH